MYVFLAGHKYRFSYENYRGETAVRNVVFYGLDYGSNEWYPEEQWFMRCFDRDKQAFRSYALARLDARNIQDCGKADS